MVTRSRPGISRWRLIVAGVALTVLVLGGVLWWAPWNDGAVDTPSCDRLVQALPGADGVWSVQEAPSREVSTRTTTCVLGVTSADAIFTGTVRVFILGSSDPQTLTREVEIGQCYGTPDQVVSTVGPRMAKACTHVVNNKALAGMYATLDNRFATVLTNLEGPSAPEADLVAYAHTVRLHVIDQALVLPADS